MIDAFQARFRQLHQRHAAILVVAAAFHETLGFHAADGARHGGRLDAEFLGDLARCQAAFLRQRQDNAVLPGIKPAFGKAVAQRRAH
ncbi:hypothetical protein D3C72_876390 [compost metagenome]